MTPAILSFTTSGQLTFRFAPSQHLHIEEYRRLDAAPFASWSRAYDTGYWTDRVLLALGIAIGRWLDGPEHWLSRLVQAAIPVTFTVEADPCGSPIERAAIDAPWELLAYLEPGTPAVAAEPDPVEVSDPRLPQPIRELFAQLGPIDFAHARHLMLPTVRRLIAAPTSAPPPSPYRLSMVFMAAQPERLNTLAVDREQVAIYRTVADIEMDFEVEDTGSLDQLGEMVARTECDVLHVSCLGSTTAGRASLVLEDKLGERADATADDLTSGIGGKPRLLFVSMCADAAPGPIGCNVLRTLSIELCQRGWPAVLAWPHRTTEPDAMELTGALYRQLSLRVSLVDAFAKACTAGGRAWHTARLYLRPEGGGPIVAGSARRPSQRDAGLDRRFLDPNRRIRIAAPNEPFPHRRELQRALHGLRAHKHSGILIHGGDDVGRATFADRVLRRIAWELPRVVIHRDFDAPAILDAIRAQTASAGVAAIASQYRPVLSHDADQLLEAVRATLVGPGRNAGAFALVLHGFEPAGRPGRHRSLSASQLPVARALIGAFAGADTASRLMFTSAVPFSIAGLTGSLFAQSLDGEHHNVVTAISLSHSREDRALVELIAEDLRACDLDLEIDDLELESGESALARVTAEADESVIVLAFASSASVTSRWILEDGAPRSGIVVLPVLVPGLDDADLPPALRRRVAADLRRPDGYDRFFEALLERLDPDALPTQELQHHGLTLDYTRKNRLHSAARSGLQSWITDYLVARTRSQDDTERYWAYIGLGQLNTPHARDVLEGGLAEDSLFAREGAITALQMVDEAQRTTASGGEG